MNLYITEARLAARIQSRVTDMFGEDQPMLL